MEKMENIVFDRNYEEDKPDPLAQAIFDRVNAPGGFLEEFSKKMDAIPKVIVPKDKENYEYLLERCDEFARHRGKGTLLLHYHAGRRQVPFSCYDQLF